MNVSSSVNDLLLQALSGQSTGTASSAGSSKTSDLLKSADFGKLLELQMQQSMLSLSGFGAADDSSSSGSDNAYAALMGLSSGNSGLGGGSQDSLQLLQLLEKLVDRLSALEQTMAPAAASAYAAAAAAAAAPAAPDPVGIAPAESASAMP